MNEKVVSQEAADPVVLTTDRDVADYIERLTDTMVVMTAGRDMRALRYFLELVRAEAAELGKSFKQQ